MMAATRGLARMAAIATTTNAARASWRGVAPFQPQQRFGLMRLMLREDDGVVCATHAAFGSSPVRRFGAGAIHRPRCMMSGGHLQRLSREGLIDVAGATFLMPRRIPKNSKAKVIAAERAKALVNELEGQALQDDPKGAFDPVAALDAIDAVHAVRGTTRSVRFKAIFHSVGLTGDPDLARRAFAAYDTNLRMMAQQKMVSPAHRQRAFACLANAPRRVPNPGCPTSSRAAHR